MGSALLLFGYGCATTPVHTTHPQTPPVQAPAATGETNSAFAVPTQLTATLDCSSTNGCDATLHWQNHATADGGNWVEFATPGSDFTKLEVYLSEANGTSFVHPRLAPQTQFIYHIQPFFGQATVPVAITTGIANTNSADLEEGPIATTNAVADTTPKKSIRSLDTFAQAAPGDLTATLSSPTSVDLHWTDRASDEDGFLVEMGPQKDGRFYVCALLPPDTTSFRKIMLPENTAIYFRVRAFFYSKPSETVSVQTP